MGSLVEALFDAIWADIHGVPGIAEKWKEKEDFEEAYDSVLNRKHPTHIFIKLVTQTYSGEDYVSDGVIEKDYFEWLCKTDPLIDMGEVNGKHSDCEGNFSSFLGYQSDDYYEIVDHGVNERPSQLSTYDSSYEEYKLLKAAYAKWADDGVAAGRFTRDDLSEFKDDVHEDWIDYETAAEYVQCLDASFDAWNSDSNRKNNQSESKRTRTSE